MRGHVFSLAVVSAGLLATAAPAQYRSYYPPSQSPPPPSVYAPSYEQAPAPQPLGQPQQPALPAGYKPVYRLVAVSGRDHLYTTDANEVNRLAQQGTYRYEGPAFAVLDRHYANSVPLYRFSTPTARHFLSPDPNAGVPQGAVLEGPIGYADAQQQRNTVPLYAWYSPQWGDYLYTTNPTGEMAPGLGYQSLGVIAYVVRTS